MLRILKRRGRRENAVVVVSGLPRSGTSLMMQMLDAGGLPLLVDGVRRADESNPRGYYEYEPVKRMGRDGAAWMVDAQGKGVKVVSPLLTYLPDNVTYRVIFMERDLDEVLQSQHRMRDRLDTGDDQAVRQLHAEYKHHLAEIRGWLARQPHIETVYVTYRRAVAEPDPTAHKVAAFLDVPLDTRSMAQVVDPTLYRERKTPHL